MSLISVGHLLVAQSQPQGRPNTHDALWHLDDQGVFLEEIAIPAEFHGANGPQIYDINWFGNHFYVSTRPNVVGVFGIVRILEYDEQGVYVRVAVNPNDADIGQNNPDDPTPNPWGGTGFNIRSDGSFVLHNRNYAAGFFIYDQDGNFQQRIVSTSVIHTKQQWTLRDDDCAVHFFTDSLPNRHERIDLCQGGLELADLANLPTDYQGTAPEILPNGNMIATISQFLGGTPNFNARWLSLDASGAVLLDVLSSAAESTSASVRARYTDRGSAFWMGRQIESGSARDVRMLKYDISSGSLLVTSEAFPTGDPSDSHIDAFAVRREQVAARRRGIASVIG